MTDKDIKVVNNFLEETDYHFIDPMMVRTASLIDNVIYGKIGEAIVQHGILVDVDAERVKKWVELCIRLENLSDADCQYYALRAKINRLQSQVDALTKEKAELKEQLTSFKESWERMLKF